MIRSDRGMEGSVNTSGVDVGPRVGVGNVGGESDVVRNDIVGSGRGVAVCGLALSVSATAVLTVEMAVCIISASFIVGADWNLLQDPSIATRNKGMIVLMKMFISPPGGS